MKEVFQFNKIGFVLLCMIWVSCLGSEVNSRTPIKNNKEKSNLKKEYLKVHELDVEGHNRVLTVGYPNKPKGEKKLPLVLVLHGGGQNMRKFERKTNWTALSQKEGFCVAYLQAQEVCLDVEGERKSGNYWMTSTKQTQFCGEMPFHSDSDYLDLAVAEIVRNYAIDIDRIYAAGFSNGFGYILQNIITRKPNIFKAVGGVGSMIHLPIKGQGEMPVYMMIGSKDDRFTKHSKVDSFLMEDEYAVFNDPTQGTCIKYLTSYLDVGRDYKLSRGDHYLEIDFISLNEMANSRLRYRLLEGVGHRFPDGSKKVHHFDASQMLWEFFKEY